MESSPFNQSPWAPEDLEDLYASTNLTRHQLLIWLGQRVLSDLPLYNIPFAFSIDGEIDPHRFGNAFRRIVQSHDNLRTVFGERAGVPWQEVLPSIDYQMEFHDFSRQGGQSAAKAWMDSRAQAVLKLDSRGFDTALLRTDTGKFIWYLNIHQILSDLSTFSLLFRRTADNYEAEGRPNLIEPVFPSFAGYVAEERSARTSVAFDEARAFWQSKFENLPAPLSYYGRPLRKTSMVAQRVPVQLGVERTGRIQQLAQSEGISAKSWGPSLFNPAAGALLAFLFRVGGRRQPIIGATFHNRHTDAQRQIAGLVMQIHPLRVEIQPEDTFLTLTRRVATEAVSARGHGLFMMANPLHDRIYDVLLNVQPGSFGAFAGMSTATELLNPTVHQTESLVLQVNDFNATGNLNLEFDIGQEPFEGIEPDAIVHHYLSLLDALIENPDRQFDSVDILSPSEKRSLLVDFGSGEHWPLADDRIHLLFDAQAHKSPREVALRSGQMTITYDELLKVSEWWANRLIEAGVRPGSVVGLLAERTPETVIGMLGILKAGAAFLPLDPSEPRDRLAFILRDSRASLLLTQSSLLPALGDWVGGVICLDTRQQVSASGSEDSLLPGDGSAAYVIYTSGSTGKPKGVIGTHRGALNRFEWMWRTYPFAKGEICAQKTSIGFVDSLWEIFGPLLQGIPSVLIPTEVVRDPLRLVQALASERVTRLVLVPSLLSEILELPMDLGRVLASLRVCISSGEQLSRSLATRFRDQLPQCRLLNLYGMSEASADVTCYDTGEMSPDLSSVPIGRPIDNTRVYVVDQHEHLTPVGVPGELMVGGEGLALGYLDRQDLTRTRFIPDPFIGQAPHRVYRTGDIVRFLTDGGIEYLGRADQQVKLRGHRVEIGEIEAVLAQHPKVSQAVVVADAMPSGDARLVAYMVPSSADLPDSREIQAFLRERLPSFMLPALQIWIEAMPQSEHGKIDRSLLPECEPLRIASAESLTRSEDSVQELLVSIWQELLAVSPIGINDDFFDLGGHSLLAVRLMGRIEKETRIRLPAIAVYEAPTIRQLAMRLRGDGLRTESSCLVALQSRGSNPPLYCIHWAGGQVVVYNQLARLLGEGQPFYGIQAIGLDGNRPPQTSIEAMAARYLEEITHIQPVGPYYLMGASMGGKVAWEMAQRLNSAGHTVAFLGLIDTWGAFPMRPMPIQERVRLHSERLAGLSLKLRAEYLRERTLVRFRRASYYALVRAGMPLPWFMRDLTMTTIIASTRYRPRPYPGRITLFRASERRPGQPQDLFMGWDRLAPGGMEVHEVPGEHASLLTKPSVDTLASELKKCLETARALG